MKDIAFLLLDLSYDDDNNNLIMVRFIVVRFIMVRFITVRIIVVRFIEMLFPLDYYLLYFYCMFDEHEVLLLVNHVQGVINV